VNVERIMPVAYSPVTNRTPRTPTTSCVIKKPRTGAEASFSSSSRGGDPSRDAAPQSAVEVA
jgi:hypothetical protein